MTGHGQAVLGQVTPERRRQLAGLRLQRLEVAVVHLALPLGTPSSFDTNFFIIHRSADRLVDRRIEVPGARVPGTLIRLYIVNES